MCYMLTGVMCLACHMPPTHASLLCFKSGRVYLAKPNYGERGPKAASSWSQRVSTKWQILNVSLEKHCGPVETCIFGASFPDLQVLTYDSKFSLSLPRPKSQCPPFCLLHCWPQALWFSRGLSHVSNVGALSKRHVMCAPPLSFMILSCVS